MPVEPEVVPEPEPADPGNPVWEAGGIEKFAIALFAIMLWVWIYVRIRHQAEEPP